MNDADYKEMKKGGMMRQKDPGLFSVRLRVVGGNLSTAQVGAIREAADRFGTGTVHLTMRQGIEIPSVPAGSLAELKAFLSRSGVGVGVCGPTVRTVTACQGCRVCPSGIIDSPALAEVLDGGFYGKPVPHKFKLGISGCANNCIKAEENDLGVKGFVEPRWSRDGCAFCGICEAVCPATAVAVLESDGRVSVDLSACVGCGDCVASCPRGSMKEGSRGFCLYAGGKFGRSPLLGKRILHLLRTGEEAVAAIGAAVEFFRRHGRPRERFGDTLRRTGIPALETFIGERTAWKE